MVTLETTAVAQIEKYKRKEIGLAQYILGPKAIILSESLLRNNNSYFK